jgi:hypothetical protein
LDVRAAVGAEFARFAAIVVRVQMLILHRRISRLLIAAFAEKTSAGALRAVIAPNVNGI